MAALAPALLHGPSDAPIDSAAAPAPAGSESSRQTPSPASSRTLAESDPAATGKAQDAATAGEDERKAQDAGTAGDHRPIERTPTSFLASQNHPREPLSRFNVAQVFAERSAEKGPPRRTDELRNVKRTDSGLQLGWEEGDPRNPLNWSRRRRWLITVFASVLTVNVTCSFVYHRGFVNGLWHFAREDVAGPFIWAPGSELIGRQPIFIGAIGAYMLFQMGPALAQNEATLWSTRFLGGCAAAAPITNSGGLIADIWDPVDRGAAMSLFTVSVMGPIVGGFVTPTYLTWRWVFWLQMIFAAACWVPCCLIIPETYAPVLLKKRAKELRALHPELAHELYAPLEHSDQSFKGILQRTLLRPFHMLALEPILILVTIYLSVVYALLYATFSVFPLIWEEGQGLRDLNAGETGLIFIGVGLGAILGGITNVFLSRPFRHLTPKWRGTPPPEYRLYGAMLAGPSLAIGLFWLGWTGAFASVPWYVPALATIPLGYSFSLVFLAFLPFLIDCYGPFAASALAANTICRSALAAVFPLFTVQMFRGLTIQWACTLLGCVALVLAPSPFLFYRYGHKIRSRSRFAPASDLKIRDEILREEKEGKKDSEKPPA